MIKAEVQARVALARLMVAEELLDNLPGELGMRTALSRGYYGLLHSSQAFLLTIGQKQAGRDLSHGTVYKLLNRERGAEAGRIYENAMRTRKDADYREAATFEPLSVSRQVKAIRTQVKELCLEAGKFLQ